MKRPNRSVETSSQASQRKGKNARSKIDGRPTVIVVVLNEDLSFAKRRQLSYPHIRPPTNCEFLLYLLVEKSEREGAVGDLIEMYPKIFERLGATRAKLWAYGEAVRAIWPRVRRLIARMTGSIIVTDWIRRHL